MMLYLQSSYHFFLLSRSTKARANLERHPWSAVVQGGWYACSQGLPTEKKKKEKRNRL